MPYADAVIQVAIDRRFSTWPVVCGCKDSGAFQLCSTCGLPTSNGRLILVLMELQAKMEESIRAR